MSVDHSLGERKLDEAIPAIVLIDPNLPDIFALTVRTIEHWKRPLTVF